MPDCALCKNGFPRLDRDTEACAKCRARKPGMSAAEYAVINVRYLFFQSHLENLKIKKRINLSVQLVE
jgi:hypothetical protein